MKYQFSLQVLLEHRKNLENEARRVYNEAQAQVDAATKELNRFYDQVDSARAENGQLERAGTSPSALVANDDFIAGQKYRIEAQRKKIRDLKTVAEELHEKMVEAAKETKSLEKLKERRADEFKKEMRKNELKVNDEIVTLRHKREGGMV